MTSWMTSLQGASASRLVRKLPIEVWIVLALIIMPFALLAGGGSVDTAIRILLWGIFGVGFDILFGYAGLLSFGQAAFFGTGGFVTAYLLVSGVVTSVPLAITAGVLASILFSFAIGFISLRRVGIYFAMITFAIGELCFFVQHSILSKWTGGDNGLPGVPSPQFSLGNWSYKMTAGWDMYAVILVVFVCAFWVARRLVESPFGRVLNATRINADRTLAVGHDIQRYKMAAFVVAATYAAMAGALMGVFQSFVGPDALSLETSGQVVMQTVIGGVRTLIGPLIGAAVWIYLRDILQQIPGIGGMWKLILGAMFILAVITMPRGIVGEVRYLLNNRRVAQALAKFNANSDFSASSVKVPATPVAKIAQRQSRLSFPVVIEARNLRKEFGSLVVLEDVCLSVHEGEIMGLIGPNGAGKSTLFRMLAGDMTPTSGQVILNGKDITAVGVREACRMGISKSYQIVQIYPELSVRENLLIPLLARKRGSFCFDVLATIKGDPSLLRDADALLVEMGLDDRDGAPVSDQSYGEKRRLEIAIALATNPQVLLLDEPLAGLSAEERVQVVDVIRKASVGRTVLVVEHDMDSLFGLADRVAVLHLGRNLAVGPPADIRENPIVHSAYLGVPYEGRSDHAA